MSGRCLLSCLVGLTLGCGDALPPTSYQGEAVYAHPLVVVTGVPPAAGDLRIALFWMVDGVEGEPAEVIEQVDTGRPAAVGAGPLRVFDRPDAALWGRLTADGRGYAIGRFALYADTNGNGRRDDDEPLAGDSTHALVYAPEAVPAEASPSGRALPAGFHKTELPFACAPSLAPVSPDCDVALGAPCLREEVCGTQGTCLKVDEGWPGGHCAAAQGSACRPADAAVEVVNTPESSWGRWVRACADDADCRGEQGYHCDRVAGACLVDDGFVVTLGRPTARGACSAVDPGQAGGDGPSGGGGPGPGGGVVSCAADDDCAAACPGDVALGCACINPPRVGVCGFRCADDAVCAAAPGPPDQTCRDGLCLPPPR